MDNKEAAQIITDVIEVAQRPVIVNGAVYREHSRLVKLDNGSLEALLLAKKELLCKNTTFGGYECYEETMHGFAVDSCLVGEINRLNNNNIKTIGCCCGHSRSQGYIQVAPEFMGEMEKSGYERLPLDKNGNGKWCFKPKTTLMKP